MYGWAMSKCLPMGGFELIDFEVFDSNGFSDNSLKGCIQEVYLEHPKESQDFIPVKSHGWFYSQTNSFVSKLTVLW